MNKVVKAYRLYKNGDFVDDVDSTLPDIENLTADNGGAGVLGNFEMPLLGIVENMTTTINLHNVSRKEAGLMTGAHNLEIRGSEQYYDQASGEYKEDAVRYVMRTAPKKLSGGSMKRGEANGSSFEGNLLYYKKEVNGEVIEEVDKFAMKCIIDGVDLLAQTRANVGM